MSEKSKTEKEAAQVARLLEPLTAAAASTPPADAVYWRARARLVLDEARRRRSETLRPLRVLHLALGRGAIALAALGLLLTSSSRGPGQLLVLPLLIAALAVGARLLAEAAELGSADG